MIKAMKLKHVLFSSLFLSVGFTACTNDELVDVQAPVVDTENAVSLGEGYTIIATKAANEASRAYMESLNAAVWEKTDTIGAAWYDMITAYDEDGTVAKSEAFDGKFSSYTWFKWDSQAGNNMSSAYFKSAANLSAGAYVLYYPYKKGELTYSQDGIPVSIATNQEMDCTEGNQLKGISKNIFAYAPVAFINGGEDQTREFKLNQLTNVLAISFKVEASDIFKLVKDVKIAKVIVKADNMVSDGIISVPTVVDYNAGKYGEAKFEGGTTSAEQIILDVKNASDAYTIKAIDTPTEYFYLSVLPLKANATSLTVQILTEDGKVYSKTMNDLSAFNELAKKEGQQIKLNVTLDKLEDVGTIYTADQFKTQWEEALAGERTELNVAEGLDLSDVDLTVNNAKANITITGKDVKVKSLSVTNGSLTINNKLTVAGDVKVGADAAPIATGTNGTLNVEGTMTVEGTTGDLTVGKIAGLDIAKSGKVTLKGADDKSELSTVNNRGELTLSDVTLTKELTNTGDLTVNGTVNNKGIVNQNGEMTTDSSAEFYNNAGATLNINVDTPNITIVNAEKTDKAAAAVINVAKGITLTATSSAKSIENNGIINVEGTLTEKGSNALIQTAADARIVVGKEGKVNLNKTTAVSAGRIIVTSTSQVNNTTNSCIATEITDEKGFANIDGITDVVMKGNFTIETDSKFTEGNHNFFIEGGTLTLAGNIAMASTVYIEGDVTVNTTAKTATWKLEATSNNINATLTLGKNVTLSGNNGASVTVSKDGDIKGEGTVDTGNLTVTKNF